jgi:hypothetical protein
MNVNHKYWGDAFGWKAPLFMALDWEITAAQFLVDLLG